MLEKIKVLLGITGTEKDALINIYIEQAQKEIEIYTQQPFEIAMESLAEQMAVEKYNRRFSEGVSSTSTSGLSTSFKDGYSKEIMLQLNQLKRRVRFL
ncbi:phage head-tail connector protein [Zhenhengia yiwuensis]|uniref:phage head-tail connector protein n=1 Tax=Zhenhengia yiwuensis TaxID=2763666 RepID=UPI002A754F9C|nr:phage head-tail connector protein [Zhenhengia yiwuensis]MDY3368400.1 phage head-tail connector protein [Zhenhengia yiwuensis]